MSQYLQNKDFYGHPFLLTEEQKKKPLEVINGFFESLRLYEAREDLANLLKMALTSEGDEFSEPSQRANVIYFCQLIEELMEAAYILNSKELY